MPITSRKLDSIARKYHSNDILRDKFIEDACQQYTYDWVFSHIRNNCKVLEMGYGEGNFTRELVNRGYQPTVLEGSEVLANVARSIYKDQIKCVRDMFETYKPDSPYDCIIATHVLEHVDSPIALLKIMKGWLTTSGRIIVIVPNSESLHRQLAVLAGVQQSYDTLSPRDILVGHQRVYSLKGLTRDVLKSGMQVVESTGFFLKTLPNSMMLEFPKNLVKALNEVSPLLPPNLLANIGIVAKLRR